MHIFGVWTRLLFKIYLTHKLSENQDAYGIRVLIKVRNYFSLLTLVNLYYDFIHSHINYCIWYWGLTYDIHLLPMKRIQNRAIRLITLGSLNSHVTSLYQHLDLHPLDKLMVYNLGITSYRLFTYKSVLYIIGINDLTNPKPNTIFFTT